MKKIIALVSLALVTAAAVVLRRQERIAMAEADAWAAADLDATR